MWDFGVAGAGLDRPVFQRKSIADVATMAD